MRTLATPEPIKDCRRRRHYLRLCTLLQRACAIGRRRPALADATLRTYCYKLDAELDALLRIIPTHTAGDKLQQAIAGCRRFLFTFLANRAIPPTIQRLRAIIPDKHPQQILRNSTCPKIPSRLRRCRRNGHDRAILLSGRFASKQWARLGLRLEFPPIEQLTFERGEETLRASRRLVLIRSPALIGISDGATTARRARRPCAAPPL